MTYQPKHHSSSRFLSVRNLRYHVRTWGDPSLPPLVMVHGWMDVSASFQFIADLLADRFHILAPDWRGYGLTDWPQTDTYWFADYLADLDGLLDQLVGDKPLPIVGHSMGGNVVMLYGGIRPQRCTHVINLEGFGLGATTSDKAPRRYAKWMDELKTKPSMRPYASIADVAAKLIKNNPRLSQDKADFLAPHWAAQKGEQWEILGDPWHRGISPVLYRVEEVLACWRAITAPTLWVEAAQTDSRKFLGGIPDFEERLTHVPKLTKAMVQDAGHMLHHDQPQEVARLINEFIA
ncbi:MAG: alpha/beta fold hydrolase [Burkholderiaceae bacterium]